MGMIVCRFELMGKDEFVSWRDDKGFEIIFDLFEL